MYRCKLFMQNMKLVCNDIKIDYKYGILSINFYIR